MQLLPQDDLFETLYVAVACDALAAKCFANTPSDRGDMLSDRNISTQRVLKSLKSYRSGWKDSMRSIFSPGAPLQVSVIASLFVCIKKKPSNIYISNINGSICTRF